MLTVLLSAAAWAGSISAPGIHAGPDASAATPGAHAVVYNPAALSAQPVRELLVDTQLAWVRAELTTTRNDGIDPNTDAPYAPAQASVASAVGYVAIAAPLIPGRLGGGLSVHNPFTGGASYLKNEPDPDSVFTGHQRYHGVRSILASLAVTGALGARVGEGVHLGLSGAWYIDYATILRAARVTGDEGAPDYSNDVILSGSAVGGHPGASAGIYVDRWPRLRLGASVQWSGTFRAQGGSGEVSVPGSFTDSGQREVLPLGFGITFPLAPVVRLHASAPIGEGEVGVGWENQLWNLCCGDADGDIVASIASADGDALGAEDGLALEISETIYSPRRLWNANTVFVQGSRPLNDWHLSGQARYNQFAVPDYAVSASNLDFDTIILQLAGRREVREGLSLGLSYSRIFLLSRTITDSAWNLGDGNARFSPAAPATTSGVGTYQASADLLGVQLRRRW
ncbi:MAG: long-subunit fatty acid transport protein [Myxococcota bacterium]|jgi:long-subunit fatty acid transport protein